MEKDFKQFEKKTGVIFKDRALLKAAFTHRSYVNEHGGGTHNERLEFLGDAVVELITTTNLFAKYPEKSEGDLTAYRAALVNTATLAKVAEELGMNECLLLSRGEAKDTGRARQTILANAFEAVTGALYLDQGYAAAEGFVARHLMERADDIVASGAFRDAKSRFQEETQASEGVTPRYEVVRAEGPDHARTFVVNLMVGKRLAATGEGQSKQEAEQAAAEKALAQS